MRSRTRLALLTSVVASAVLVAAGCSSSGGDSTKHGSAKSPIRFAYSAAVMQTEKVPLHLTLEQLNEQGQKTSESFSESGDDTVQKVARGEADFGVANVPTVFGAIKKGVPIKAVMTAYFPAYLLVAPTSVANAGQLDGKRVGIQSKVSATTFYTDLALAKYPSVKPKTLIVPSSASRIQAMLAGQLDASVIQFADWLTMQKKAPGKFHILYDVAKANPNITDSVIFTSTKTIASSKDYVKSFLDAVRAEYAKLYSNPSQLATDIMANVQGTTAAGAKELVKFAIGDRIWPADGGFTPDRITATINAIVSSKILSATDLPTLSQCCDTSFVAGK